MHYCIKKFILTGRCEWLQHMNCPQKKIYFYFILLKVRGCPRGPRIMLCPRARAGSQQPWLRWGGCEGEGLLYEQHRIALVLDSIIECVWVHNPCSSIISKMFGFQPQSWVQRKRKVCERGQSVSLHTCTCIVLAYRCVGVAWCS